MTSARRTGRYPLRHPHTFQNATGQHDYCDYLSTEGNHCGYSKKDHRWPCSPTCTHDDAWTPGHPERAGERSEAFKSELELEHDHPEAFAAGAEAMRAACLSAAREALANIGAWDRETERIVKSAIEGATP